MSKYFLFAAAFLLLISAAFGFLDKQKLAAKNTALMQETSSKQSALDESAKSAATIKKAERAAAEANSKANDLQTAASATSKEVTDLTGQIDEAHKNIATKDAEIQGLNDKIKAADATKNIPGVPAAPGLADQLKEAQTQVAEMKALKETLELQLRGAQTQLASAQKQIQDRATKASMNGLRGRVLAVDRNWNFVVLDLGNRNGVVSDATMIVQRGSSMVGRVRVTSVEPSQSIADIIPNSVPAGISVQPGDSVVFPGT